MDIKKIKPYLLNAKKHPEKQLQQLANIVREVGWRQPVVVNQDGVIVVGHGRFEAFTRFGKELGLKPIWVIDDKGATLHGGPETNPMTPEQERVYRIADNKLNESEWDMELLREDLGSMPDMQIDLSGFDKSLILGGEGENTEISPVDLGEMSTVTFKYTHQKYLEMMEKIAAVREQTGAKSNEDLLEMLLDEHV